MKNMHIHCPLFFIEQVANINISHSMYTPRLKSMSVFYKLRSRKCLIFKKILEYNYDYICSNKGCIKYMTGVIDIAPGLTQPQKRGTFPKSI